MRVIIFVFFGFIQNFYAQNPLTDCCLSTGRDSFMFQMKGFKDSMVLKIKPNIFHSIADSFLEVDRNNSDFSIAFFVYVDYDGEVCLMHFIRGNYSNIILDKILNQPIHSEIINCPKYLYGKKIYSYLFYYKEKNDKK